MNIQFDCGHNQALVVDSGVPGDWRRFPNARPCDLRNVPDMLRRI